MNSHNNNLQEKSQRVQYQQNNLLKLDELNKINTDLFKQKQNQGSPYKNQNINTINPDNFQTQIKEKLGLGFQNNREIPLYGSSGADPTSLLPFKHSIKPPTNIPPNSLQQQKPQTKIQTQPISTKKSNTPQQHNTSLIQTPQHNPHINQQFPSQQYFPPPPQMFPAYPMPPPQRQQPKRDEMQNQFMDSLSDTLKQQNDLINNFIENIEKDNQIQTNAPQYENRLKELEKEMQFMHEMKQIKSQLQNMDYQRQQKLQNIQETKSNRKNDLKPKRQLPNEQVPSFLAALNPINRLMKKQNRTNDRALNNSNPFRNLYDNPLFDPQLNPLMNHLNMPSFNPYFPMFQQQPQQLPWGQQQNVMFPQMPPQMFDPMNFDPMMMGGAPTPDQEQFYQQNGYPDYTDQQMMKEMQDEQKKEDVDDNQIKKQDDDVDEIERKKQLDELRKIHQETQDKKDDEAQVKAYKALGIKVFSKDEKKRLVKIMRKHFILQGFPVLLKTQLRKQIKNRKADFYDNIEVKIQNAMIYATHWGLTTSKGLAPLLGKQAINCNIIYTIQNKKPNQNEHQKRLEICYGIIGSLLDGLINQTSKEKLNPELIQFIGSICLHNSFLPNR